MPEMFPDVTISDVRFGDEKKDLRFEVNTSNYDINQVKEELKKIFAGKLVVNDMEIKGISPIGASKTGKRAVQGGNSGGKAGGEDRAGRDAGRAARRARQTDESGQKKQSRHI